MIGLIRHLSWNDLRSQRVPLLAWAAVLAVQATVIFGGLVPGSRTLGGQAIPIVRCLITAVLAALIVQRDSLVGTTAFWLTRPIPRTALFASKLVSLSAALVVVPAIVASAIWWSTGALPADVLTAARAVAIEQAVVTLLAVMAASVTSSMNHLVVAGIAGGTLVTVFNGILLPAVLMNRPFLGQSLGGWQPTMFMVTLFVFGLPAIAHQYFTRREWRTAALIAFTLLAATVVMRAWPDDVRTIPARPVDRAIVNPEAIVATIDPGTIKEEDWTFHGTGGVALPQRRYVADFTADGQPDAVLLWPVAINSRLVLPDQTVSYQRSATYGGLSRPKSSTQRDLTHLALQAALGASAQLPEPSAVPNGVDWSATEFNGLVVASVPADVALRNQGQRAIVRANVTFHARRYRVRSVVPARPGGRIAFPGSAIEIVSVSGVGNATSIQLREARVRSDDRDFTVMSMPVFCLRNAERHEAFLLGNRRYATEAPLTLNLLRIGAGMLTRAWEVSAVSPSIRRVEGASRIDEAWLSGAEVVRLEPEDLGNFDRPLQAEFTLGGKKK